MPEGKPRDYYFDHLKFVLIVLVVVGHALEPLYTTSLSARTMYTFIYFFHIPLFVFVTGYFSKKLDKLSDLVALYIIFQVLYTTMDFYLNDRTALHLSFSLPYWVTWYLLAAILWKLILPYFIRLKYPIVIASILAVFAGYSSLGYSLTLLRAVNFFPFFIAGYYMKRDYLHYLLTLPVKISSVFIIVIAFYMIYTFGHSINCEWLWGSYSYKDMGSAEWYAGMLRIAAASVTIALSISVLSLIPVGCSWVSQLGSRTMYPFLLHGFIVKYVMHQGLYHHIRTGLDEFLLVFSAIAVTIVLSMKWVEPCLSWLFQPQLSFLYKRKDGTTRNIHA